MHGGAEGKQSLCILKILGRKQRKHHGTGAVTDGSGFIGAAVCRHLVKDPALPSSMSIALHTKRFRCLLVSTNEVYGSLGPKGFFNEDTTTNSESKRGPIVLRRHGTQLISCPRPGRSPS